MSETVKHFSAPAPLVALCGWLLPGSGYLLIGHKTRGIVIGVTIIVLFVLGLLIAGIRVVDVPGFDRGTAVYVNSSGTKVFRPGPNDRWAMKARPFSEIANKPWFVGQVLAGPICLISARWSLDLAKPTQEDPRGWPASHARIAEIGTLYTAIAGMLNLLATLDAAWRAGQGAG
jgi:hypothetical protein